MINRVMSHCFSWNRPESTSIDNLSLIETIPFLCPFQFEPLDIKQQELIWFPRYGVNVDSSKYMYLNGYAYVPVSKTEQFQWYLHCGVFKDPLTNESVDLDQGLAPVLVTSPDRWSQPRKLYKRDLPSHPWSAQGPHFDSGNSLTSVSEYLHVVAETYAEMFRTGRLPNYMM